MITMKVTNINGEILLAAADSELVGREFRSGRLHINVKPEFYGEMKVSDETFLSTMNICTIANLVGRHVIDLAIKANFIDPENVINIGDVPHAQMARMPE
ncbi:DUF424 domain-containing protein [Picrophilus oshimae]|uniref:DUF424 domain-containing protein n=1 Tax=Picrophilus torridus (strain ATCC 700027 / DSM 9790 / JCM 10055 / NBRC 100828 / KAW 2/3) TaxID=1122961 RepID=Q6KZP9_PICTO|nr:DUF424 family protein [Picrophilus oshimae]AAT43803.1 hypothetical protein PTO1218 [Picrophilus oshimae DSM 9789]SMD31129.1 hypothetical protein SAMN02745355_1049 [Picrophilus oshimae DSM 9789]